jgi:ABC-type antimicrobial peptide transport system permease subunit
MLDRIAARAVAGSRYDTMLMSLFAALAVTLALIGCYGVLAYSIAQRTREIGVRVALGASHRMIMRDVVLRGLAVVVIGLCVGVGLALALTRVLEGSLYGVTPTDPVTFATAVAGLFLVSLVAVWVPARRAVAIQPIEALRIE